MKKIGYSVILLMLLISCSTTEIIRSHIPHGSGGNYKNILVLGSSEDRSRKIQMYIENEITKTFTASGCHAKPSLSSYSAEIYDVQSERKATEKLIQTGFDAILTLVLAEENNAGNVYRDAGDFRSYYDMMLSSKATYTYPRSAGGYHWEIYLFDVKTMKSVYSATTKNFSFSSPEEMCAGYGRLVAQKIIADKMVSPF